MIEAISFKSVIKTAALLLALMVLTGMAKQTPLVGGPAPGIHLNTLQGNPVVLKTFRGKVVLLTFWATWCKSCVKEFEEIRAAYQTLKGNGFEVLAVNVGEQPAQVASSVKQQRLPFVTVLDRKAKLAARYGVTGLPVSFFIDPQGIVQKRVVGELLTHENIRSVHQELQKLRK